MSKVVPYPTENEELCSIKISCSKPSKNGDMEVEMVVEGNEDLASLLIENAYKLIHERIF